MMLFSTNQQFELDSFEMKRQLRTFQKWVRVDVIKSVSVRRITSDRFNYHILVQIEIMERLQTVFLTLNKQ